MAIHTSISVEKSEASKNIQLPIFLKKNIKMLLLQEHSYMLTMSDLHKVTRLF